MTRGGSSKREERADLYCWDWARAETEAVRFENLIALHLLRFVHWGARGYGDAPGRRIEGPNDLSRRKGFSRWPTRASSG